MKIIVAIVAFLLTSTVQQALAQNGKAGKDVTWTLEGGRLTISGTGAMDDYDNSTNAPDWYQYHDRISTVVIGDGITSIGDYAFYSGDNAFSSLHSVYIGNHVSSIGQCAFNGATQLKRISISEPATGVKAISIGELAFTGCNAVTDIFCGAPVFNYWASADLDFKESAVLHVKSADEWNNKEWDDNNKPRVTIQGDLNDYTGYGTPDPIGASYDSELKKLTITMSVKELPNNAANTISVMKTYKDEVETVEFQLASNATITAITAIGDEAFKGMTNLKTIYIPSTVEYIGYEAFCDCEKLEKISTYDVQEVAPTYLTAIGGRAFSGCKALEGMVVRDSLTFIGYMAFSSCTNFVNLSFSRVLSNKKPMSFGPYAFDHCTKLNDVSFIPAEVTEIPEGIFSYCTALETFECPRDVETIGEAAFEGCSSLRYVTLNNKLKTIDVNAFRNCSSLTSDNNSSSALTIPASVKVIGSEDSQYSRGEPLRAAQPSGNST